VGGTRARRSRSRSSGIWRSQDARGRVHPRRYVAGAAARGIGGRDRCAPAKPDEAYRGADPIRGVSEVADVVTRPAAQGITAEQRSAFAYATRAGGKVRVITGVPVAGKTFLIDRIADDRVDGGTSGL
jgi:hypothetical protein